MAQGTLGLLVVSTVKPSPTGLFTPGYYRQLKVPVGIIDKTADTALLRTSAAVKLTLDGRSQLIKSRNLLAQTKSSSSSDVVMAGAPADMPLSASTDYTAFLAAGVPVGGTTTGASQRKTEVQARLWGGKAGQPFDPNYHTPRDDIDNVDAHALSVMGPVVAFAVGSYAMSIDGVNGVPSHDQRKRHQG